MLRIVLELSLKNLTSWIFSAGRKMSGSKISCRGGGGKTEKEKVNWPITDWGPDVVAEIAGTTFG